MTNTPRGDILTTFQAARLCGVSHKSIERWIDAGLLPGFRTPGGHRRVYRADLLGFVQKRRTQEGAESRAVEAVSETPRILIVDDDPVIRSLFLEYFKTVHPSDFVVDVAASGYEAGLQVERTKPHVMVLDLMMPDLNGFEVCEKTRQDAAHSSIVFIALTGSESAAQQARESGLFHRVFLKPVKLSRVKEEIDEILAERGFLAGVLAGE